MWLIALIVLFGIIYITLVIKAFMSTDICKNPLPCNCKLCSGPF